MRKKKTSNLDFKGLRQDKLQNYCIDTEGDKHNVLAFDKLESRERVTYRLSAGRSIEIVTKTKFIFKYNVLPNTQKNVHEFYRKFEIIEFDVTIEEDKIGRLITVKLIENKITGVLNWILVGQERFLNHKNLTECKTNNKTFERFKTKSNHMALFFY